jgi:hypothetical protein
MLGAHREDKTVNKRRFRCFTANASSSEHTRYGIISKHTIRAVFIAGTSWFGCSSRRHRGHSCAVTVSD